MYLDLYRDYTLLFILQFVMSGKNAFEFKDPAMTLVPPYSQWRPFYNFFMPPLPDDHAIYYVIVVIKRTDLTGLR